MSDARAPEIPSDLALEPYQPDPNALYSLDATARLARVSRRSIMIYCRAGLVRPVLQPPSGMMLFTEAAIYTVRRSEALRATHGVSVSWTKTMFDLVEEVERLRAEVRFYRNR